MDQCQISDLKVGTRIICGKKWHGVVLFNNTCGYYTDEYNDEYWKSLGPGFMAQYDESGLVFQKDTDEIELADSNTPNLTSR